MKLMYPPHYHDLDLPMWGPYSKRYTGVSHLPSYRNPAFPRGSRFDISIFPSFYRRRIDPPNVNWESGYYPWDAAPDLSYFSYRFELEWKDRVYAEVAYVRPNSDDEDGVEFSCRLVNNTEVPQALALHVIGALHYPSLGPRIDTEVVPARIVNPETVPYVWIDACDAGIVHYASVEPRDNLVYDGWKRGEFFAHGFTNGKGIRLGRETGDCFRVKIPREYGNLPGTRLFLRVWAGENTDFRVHGNTVPLGSGSFALVSVPFFTEGDYLVTELEYVKGPALLMDGFLLCSKENRGKINWKQKPFPQRPEVSFHPADVRDSGINSGGETPVSDGNKPGVSFFTIKYPELSDGYYSVEWTGDDPAEARLFVADVIDEVARRRLHDHVNSTLFVNWKKEGAGKVQETEKSWANLFIRPLFLGPGEEKTVNGKIVFHPAGSGEPSPSSFSGSTSFEGGTEGPAPGSLEFSMERTRAVMLTNIVYPVYTDGAYIKHFTPGKWWDSLYTWDVGFIALGMTEISISLAMDLLNTYLAEPGDIERAFIHHGSMVPVQFYVYKEIWNKLNDRNVLEYFYEKLKHYYNFYLGKADSSTMNSQRSGLLSSWDYFYNSGGWDDYPPQQYTHEKKLSRQVTPVVITAHAIRIGKIMERAAEFLGKKADIPEYLNDQQRLSAALGTHSWDGKAGYFSYVFHDGEGNALEPLRHVSGVNFNRGLDGALPICAGAVTEEQRERLFSHLENPEELWTEIGLTTVDQSAPYFRIDGYWNGAVWFPHQWFFWKACFDYGKGDFAYKIASTALDLWRREVGESYLCFEHFIVATKRGAGWHHFGGLSAPVLNWYSAYYTPGTVTGGHDFWIENLVNKPGDGRLEFSFSGGSQFLAVIPDDADVTVNRRPVRHVKRYESASLFNGPGSGIFSASWDPR